MTAYPPFRRFILALLFCLGGLSPGLAQQPDSAPPPAADAPAAVGLPRDAATGDLEALSRMLEDDAARARFSNELRALIEARKQLGGNAPPPAAVTPAPAESKSATAAPANDEDLAKDNFGARLIFTVSNGVRRLSEQVMSGVSVLRDAPRVSAWFKSQADNRSAREFWLGLLGKLAIVLAAGYLAEWLVSRAFTRVRNRVESDPAPAIGQRVLLGAVRFCLDLFAVVAFAAATYGALALVEPGPRTRLVILAVVNAHMAVRVVLALARVLLAPSAPRLRLLHLADETAHYLYIWTRRIASVVLYGYFAAETLLLLRFGRDAHELALKVVGLVTVTMLVIFVLQNRNAVADWLRAHAAKGPLGPLLGRLADLWHLLAAAYLIAIYVVWILEVPNGFAYLIKATGLTLAIGVIARLLVSGADRLVGRAFQIGPELKLRYPGLESRANRYLPVLSRVLRYAIYAVALLFILQAWGVQSLAWLTSAGGTQLVGTALSILLVVVLAFIAWEAISVSLERYGARLDAGDPHSARARTLLPLIRTFISILLLVMVGLIVLSQIGIDITPLLAGAGVIGIAIGFGSQKLVQDVINGLFILAEDTISVGDVVSLDSYGGLVEAMTIRHIRLRDFDGSLWTVPFSEVKAVLNRTKGYSRYVFDIEVAYKEDVDQVIAVIRELGEEIRQDPEYGPMILEPLEIVGLDKFAASGMVIKARITTLPIKQWTVGREFNRRLKRRFDEVGIEIPFPTRTVYHVQSNDAPVYTGKGTGGNDAQGGQAIVAPPAGQPAQPRITPDAPDADDAKSS
ncbi:MAG TPA: mechanosensitive ion channel domain-containing protein [Alphaproteobacteria bacterium]|nr:mechanosensitive ion channel domain-containing protein [Alphaproteobacteria bacterium]